MARRRTRRRNPSWLVTAGLSTIALVVGAGIAAAAIRRGNGGGLGGGRVFYYWVEQQGTSDFGFPQFVPYIQQASSGEVFALPTESSQGAASQAARSEIFVRGGEAQEGKPVTTNPMLRRGRRRSRSLRAIR